MKRYDWKEEREKLQTWKAKPEEAVPPPPAAEPVPERRMPPAVRWVLVALAVCAVGYFLYDRNVRSAGERPAPAPVAPESKAPDAERLLREAREALRRGDNQTGVARLKAAMDAGNLEAKTILATFLIEGKILKRNVEAGVRLLREAADAGFPAARFLLAGLLIDGEKVPQDIPGGIEYLRKAAEGGYADAQFYWAALLVEGTRVERNVPLAVKFLEKAAAQGHEEARKALARWKDGGSRSDFRIGVPASPSRGFRFD